MPSSRSRLSAIHSGCGFAPPASPVRAPAATTGTPSSDATARTRAAPAASDGRTAAAGRARSATELSPAYPSSSAPATTASLPAASASLRARAPGAIAAQSRLRAVVQPRATGHGFRPYAWAETAAQVAARHGLSPAHVLRFDANLPALPAPLPVAARRALAERGEYPEGSYAELRADAASYAGCAPAEVVVDAGADGLLYLVARAFLGPGRRAVVPGPTYPVYAIASRGEGAAVDEQPAADLDALRSAARDAHVLWLCNPGNPDGRLVRPAEIAVLADALPDTLVCVDEAYFEYCDETVAPLALERDNLVAVRTLSKAFGLAGLRVGYAVASAEVARELTARRSPAPVAGAAALLASAALRDPSVARAEIDATRAERARVQRALADAGYDAEPTHTNFVYVRTPDARSISAMLERKGLVVRAYDGALRMT